MKPIDVLAGVDPGLDRALYEGSQEMNVGTLASFIMNYTIYAYPNKEKLKKSLQVIHYNKFCEAKDKKEPNYDHKLSMSSSLPLILQLSSGFMRTAT
jgi:hypothetical protein